MLTLDQHSNQKLEAKSINLSGSNSISYSEIKTRVLAGEIIIVPECLQTIGMFSQVQKASLDGIGQAIGSEQANAVKEAGFENVHKIIGIDEITSVSDCTYASVELIAPELAKSVVQNIFQQNQPFYFERHPNVRFYIPYDTTEKRRAELNQHRWNGKITAHGPHHDSWYQCPTNGINVWFAVGPVRVGNGLNIYPEIYGKRLPCDQRGRILTNQYFGQGLSFNLDPGDALIFHGEHLHNSEINCTDQTRFVISLRMTLDKPCFLEDSPYADSYIYLRNRGGIFDQAKAKSYHLNRFVKTQLKKIFGWQSASPVLSEKASKSSYFDDTSAMLAQAIIPDDSAKRSSRKGQDKLVFGLQDLQPGQIRPLTDKLCAARLDQGDIVAFSRFCPHEGADLASGCLRDGQVICPWHGLSFELKSGTSPCKTLNSLKILPCVVSERKVEVIE